MKLANGQIAIRAWKESNYTYGQFSVETKEGNCFMIQQAFNLEDMLKKRIG